MVKIHLIVINNVNTFTIYESLLEHVTKILPKNYQNKNSGKKNVIRRGKLYVKRKLYECYKNVISML